MNSPSDLATIVAISQERIGSLSDSMKAFHTRQDKLEGEIKEVMKNVLAEMKELKKKVEDDQKINASEFKAINKYISKDEGQKTVMKFVGGFLLTLIGSLIGYYLKSKGV